MWKLPDASPWWIVCTVMLIFPTIRIFCPPKLNFVYCKSVIFNPISLTKFMSMMLDVGVGRYGDTRQPNGRPFTENTNSFSSFAYSLQRVGLECSLENLPTIVSSIVGSFLKTYFTSDILLTLIL